MRLLTLQRFAEAPLVKYGPIYYSYDSVATFWGKQYTWIIGIYNVRTEIASDYSNNNSQSKQRCTIYDKSCLVWFSVWRYGLNLHIILICSVFQRLARSEYPILWPNALEVTTKQLLACPSIIQYYEFIVSLRRFVFELFLNLRPWTPTVYSRCLQV